MCKLKKKKKMKKETITYICSNCGREKITNQNPEIPTCCKDSFWIPIQEVTDYHYSCPICGKIYLYGGLAFACHFDAMLKPIEPDENNTISVVYKGFECPECGKLYKYPGKAYNCHPGENLLPVYLRSSPIDNEPKKINEYESGAIKANVGKLRMDLLSELAIRDTAAVLTHAVENKYPERNWEKGFAWSILYASLKRHLSAWFLGEDFDPETGLSHLAHAACNIMMLQQYEYLNKDLDDRPTGMNLPMRKKEESANE